MANRQERSHYYHGKKGEQYGIWNSVKKEFQFGICEDTPMLAVARLYQKIGDGAKKYRFEPKAIPKNLIPVVTANHKAKHNLKPTDTDTNGPGMYYPEFPITPYD